MATFEFAGYAISGSPASRAVENSVLSIAVPFRTTTIAYTADAFGAATFPDVQSALIDDVPSDTVVDTIQVVTIVWDVVFESQFLSFASRDGTTDYLFQIGGDTFPDFTRNPAAYDPLINASTVAPSAVGSGFGPGEAIPLAAFGVYQGENDTLVLTNGPDTADSGPGDDVIEALAGDDLIFARDGDDEIYGGSGDDDLHGGPGTDTIEGGEGNDSITATTGADHVDGGPGNDWIFYEFDGNPNTTSRPIIDLEAETFFYLDEPLLDTGVVANIENVSFNGDNITEIYGTDSGNVIIGGRGNDTIVGHGADDTLQGLDGNDVISGGTGNDDIDGGSGTDQMVGGAGFDTMEGGDGNDIISGGAQADSLSGGGGNDLMIGGDGFDQMDGGLGDDTMTAGDSPDRLFGGDGNDLMRGGSNIGMTVDGLFGEAGNDTMFGEAGFDFLDGGIGDDSMDGGAQADNLFGRAGMDTLIGGDGLDRLFGEAGSDTMNGGAGFDTVNGGAGDDEMFGRFNADTFAFEDGHGVDVIGDFNALNDFEKLDFSALSTLNTLADVVGVGGAATQVGADVVIDTGGGNAITLVGVLRADLDGADFMF